MIAKMRVFRVVAPCAMIDVYQCFGVSCCLHHQGDLMKEAGRTSEMVVNLYQLHSAGTQNIMGLEVFKALKILIMISCSLKPCDN